MAEMNKQVIDVTATMDGIRFRARKKALDKHRANWDIKISPGLKKVLSKTVIKRCGKC